MDFLELLLLKILLLKEKYFQIFGVYFCTDILPFKLFIYNCILWSFLLLLSSWRNRRKVILIFWGSKNVYENKPLEIFFKFVMCFVLNFINHNTSWSETRGDYQTTINISLSWRNWNTSCYYFAVRWLLAGGHF